MNFFIFPTSMIVKKIMKAKWCNNHALSCQFSLATFLFLDPDKFLSRAGQDQKIIRKGPYPVVVVTGFKKFVYQRKSCGCVVNFNTRELRLWLTEIFLNTIKSIAWQSLIPVVNFQRR